MKLSIGEFSEHHHFLSIARPFVEWNFKILGWLVFASTIQFAYVKTGNPILFYVKWYSYGLLLLFIGSFVDWLLSFQRNRRTVISGNDLIAAAGLTREISEAKSPTICDRLGPFVNKIRYALAWIAGLIFSIILIGAANLATDKILNALLEFYEKTK